jgi:hypothetical protein
MFSSFTKHCTKQIAPSSDFSQSQYLLAMDACQLAAKDARFHSLLNSLLNDWNRIEMRERTVANSEDWSTSERSLAPRAGDQQSGDR